MTRLLPPRPDFTQLKHQAKDLLRAHGRKDPSACDPLRRLRRFKAAADADILSAPLALHEAQFALAMDYGFASWNAMKRYVEKVTHRPSPVRREKDRTYVTGLEKHSIGGDGVHENSMIACIAGVMAALGEEFSYEYLMGVSGMAFRVQVHQPDWCPSAACASPGFDVVPGVMRATGYRLRSIPVRHDPQPDVSIARTQPQILATIERGIPAIFISEECQLVVGHTVDGKRVVRPYAPNADGYRDTEDWPWVACILDPADLPMDRRQAVATSLRLAVTLARTPQHGEYAGGFRALELWADQLLDESRFATLSEQDWFRPALANGYCYGCLWSSRLAAETYLRSVAEDFEQPVRGQLCEIAGVYQRVHQLLGKKRPEYACAWSLQPWRIGGLKKWTPAMRLAEADALREALDLERHAIAAVEALLPLLPTQENAES